MSRILVLDNYDSFTYNLVHSIQMQTDDPIDVIRNDQLTLDEVEVYDRIILSPGPGLPKDAGLMPALIKRYAASKRILGICLGMQAIGEAFGGFLKNLDRVYHGVATPIQVKTPDHPVFANLPDTLVVGRYHSWVVNNQSVVPDLEVMAIDEQGEWMAIRHQQFDVTGLQFHPESVLTPFGNQMLGNWLTGGQGDAEFNRRIFNEWIEWEGKT